MQVEEFCFITENTYTREEILATERKVLDALNFELTSPSIRVFLRRFVKAAAASHPEEKPDPRYMGLLSIMLGGSGQPGVPSAASSHVSTQAPRQC